jgi:selenophosphate synthase
MDKEPKPRLNGFGLAGHLYNFARSSEVAIEIDHTKVPLMVGLPELVKEEAFAGGLLNNEIFTGSFVTYADNVPEWFSRTSTIRKRAAAWSSSLRRR